jgi:hypothetical protein
MERAALGVRMHSGWGVLVAVTDAAEIIERRRVEVITEGMRAKQRGNQPYHRAEQLGLPEAEKYLAEYGAECDRLARQALSNTIADLKSRGYEIIAVALVLSAGRKLPPLPRILASHPLIHAAEGELFRQTIRRSCESLAIPVFGLPDRELMNCAKALLGASSAKVLRKIARAGKSLGPPWTSDHKSAALAACVRLNALLSQNQLRACL